MSILFSASTSGAEQPVGEFLLCYKNPPLTDIHVCIDDHSVIELLDIEPNIAVGLLRNS